MSNVMKRKLKKSYPQRKSELQSVVHNAEQPPFDLASAKGPVVNYRICAPKRMAQCSPPAAFRLRATPSAGSANPRFERQKEMPDVDLEIVIRHCRCAAAKTELCVTVVFFEALVSFDSKGFTAYPWMIN
jgi:hypothetical protein